VASDAIQRRDFFIQCPVDGRVAVAYLETAEWRIEWCKRSGLVVPVAECGEICPLEISSTPVPIAAEWACPLGRGGTVLMKPD